MSDLTVLAPLVILHGNDLKHHYLYRGAVVAPGQYDSAQIKSLKAEGFLGGEEDLVEPAIDSTPAGNASLEAWQEYAKSQGKSASEIENLGRDELRDLFA